MKTVHCVAFKGESQEEELPDFHPDFPYIMSYVEPGKFPGRYVPWHWHREVELFYMQHGDLEYHTPLGTMLFPTGSGGLVNSNVLHMTRSLTDDTAQMIHIFDTSLIGGQRGSLLEQKYVLPLVGAPQVEILGLFPENPEQTAVLRALSESFRLPTDFLYEIRLRSALSELWCDLLRLSEPLRRKSGPRVFNEKIKTMMRYVQEHCAEKVAMREIAGAAFISERECFRTFHDTLNTTPAEYLRSCRVQKACEMLIDSDDPVTTIAQTCGFASSSHLNTVFRRYMECTPREFRDKNRQDFDTNRR